MNVHEGARRVKRAGQVLIAIPLCVASLLSGIALVLGLLHEGLNILAPGGMFLIVIGLFYFAIPGALLWIAGWIVEGFAKQDQSMQSTRSDRSSS